MDLVEITGFFLCSFPIWTFANKCSIIQIPCKIYIRNTIC
nr:MAG TPA: hypothetical protein [Caudoviricetes sp.]